MRKSLLVLFVIFLWLVLGIDYSQAQPLPQRRQLQDFAVRRDAGICDPTHANWGAVANNNTADTGPIQNALDDATCDGVKFPCGLFVLNNAIDIPFGKTLEGCSPVHGRYDDTFSAVASGWDGAAGDASDIVQTGVTTIAIDYDSCTGAGQDDTDPPCVSRAPSIQVRSSTTVRNLIFTEWDQDPCGCGSALPQNCTVDAYQPVIGAVNYGNQTTNVTLENLWFTNNYFPINARNMLRHHIDNVSGSPLRTGIYLDDIIDSGTVGRIHWHAGMWEESYCDPANGACTDNGTGGTCTGDSTDATLFDSTRQYMYENLIGLETGKVDGFSMVDYFQHGGATGLLFADGVGDDGETYGEMVNIEIEGTHTNIQINESAGCCGLQFTNVRLNASTVTSPPLGTNSDNDGCVNFNKHSGQIVFDGGTCRDSRGHGFWYDPVTLGTGNNSSLRINNMMIKDWGAGSTAGRAGIYLAPGVIPRSIIINGNTIKGGATANGNADYGIFLVDNMLRATTISSNNIYEFDVAGILFDSAGTGSLNVVIAANTIHNSSYNVSGGADGIVLGGAEAEQVDVVLIGNRLHTLDNGQAGDDKGIVVRAGHGSNRVVIVGNSVLDNGADSCYDNTPTNITVGNNLGTITAAATCDP